MRRAVISPFLSRFAGPFLVAAMASSCGGTDTGTYACDVPSATNHRCFEYAWTGGQQSTSDWEAQCSANNGNHVASCDHTGATGGCQTVNAAAQIVITFTAWWYSGTVASVRAACSMVPGGTYQQP